MVNVKLIYNPYFLKTELFVEETAITEGSPLAFVFGKFMNKWLESSGAWRGFFLELAAVVGTDELKIDFVGTAEDFSGLKAAADFAEKNFHLSIELKYLLDDNAQTCADAHQKLNALANFLNAQPSTNDNNFLADIRSALEKTLNAENTVEVISLVKNFPAGDILQRVAANLTLKIVVNEPNQNLTLTLFRAFTEIKRSLVLFVFDSEKISTPAVKEALRNVTRDLGNGEYAQAVYANLLFVCTDSEEISAEKIRNALAACGFEEPKLFLVDTAFAELLQKKSFETEKFTARREILSASNCKNFQHAPIPRTLKIHYEDKIARCREVVDECTECLKFYALHKPEEIKNAEERCNEALNEIALINSSLPALEQTILTYFENYALPVIVRKIYLGVRKQILAAERDLEQKISETKQDLQRLSGKIAAFNRQASQENPCQKFFDAAEAVHFDSEAFEQFFRRLKEPPLIVHTSIYVPSPVPVVKKNLVGYTASYIKLSDFREYLSVVNARLEEKMRQFIDDSAAYLVAQLLTPARNAVALLEISEQSDFQDLMTDFEKIIGGKNFNVPTVNFEFFTVLSYEEIGGGEYGSVEYVPVDQLLSEYTKKAEQFLDKHHLKLKRAAVNFLDKFNALTEKKSARPTHLQDNSQELQRLRQAIASKEKRLTAHKNNLAALKNLGNELERLLEIKP